MTTDQGKRESNVGHTGEVELTADEWSKIEEVMARARCEINIDDSFVNRDIVDNEIVHTNIDYPDITVDNKQQTADWEPFVADITVDNKQQTADWEPIVTDITVDNKEPTADWEPIAAYDLDTAGQYVSEEHSASTSGPEDVEEINSSVENDAILGFSNAIENLPDQIDYYSEMVAKTEPAETDFRMTTDQGKRESNVGHTGEVELTADEWSKIEEVMARARCEINIDDSFVNRDIVDNEIVHTNIDYADITVDNKESTADWERIVADDVYTAGQYVSEEHSASTSGPEDVEEINSSVENDAILGFSNAIEKLPDQIDYYSEMVAKTEPAETDFRMTTDQGKRESNVGHTGEVES